MKTKLLLFMALFSGVFSFSQVYVNEGFDIYGSPIGWDSVGFVRSVESSCDGSVAVMGTIVNASTPISTLTTPSYTNSNGFPIGISYSYKRLNSSVQFYAQILYEINNSGSWVQLASNLHTYTQSGCRTIGGTIAAGIVPSGSSVKFMIALAYDTGASVQVNVDQFRAIQTGPGLVGEYQFDNTLTNIYGENTFTSNANLSYTQDRFLVANKALRISGGFGTSAVIPSLPIARKSRTISLWIRPTTVSADNVIFTYGTTAVSNNPYGASFNALNMYTFSYSSNVAYATSTVINVWKHVVFTYSETTNTAKIYVNGSLANSGSHPSWNTGNSTTFYLGSLFGTASPYLGDIDDLKIYDYELTDSQIANLYTNNTLTSQNFNQNNLEVSLYPNPANDVLNIETALEIQSVEIYNIQGQKVMSANQKQINVSNLAAGMYMVRIQDADNAIATKKFVKQ
uniref:LamG-like jellyroll fold domain-containing protein n=1 Tax=Flavobacterium sp. TaxID=239 RepID=UPI004049A7ED